ncbi:uncharacterized protein LOC130890720 isoform X1 [Diorhabda carinulata]|uniref:uncharacterized protein LOC130890720 isoform X1 n=1 Tax=Diorhabda carinulata TaxID=1163345 RepID=UPI00259FF7C5|nr:uncharacterized protein LOC130890720 isoform X1 [Diorhabda carinulata]
MRMFVCLFGILILQYLGHCEVHVRSPRISMRSYTSPPEKMISPFDETEVKNSSILKRREHLISDSDGNKKKTLPVSDIVDNLYYVDPILKGDFNEAWFFCKEYFMEVLSVEDSNELQNIKYFMMVENDNKFDNKVSFYTSGKRLNKAGFWMWMDTGKPVNRDIIIENRMSGDCMILEYDFSTNEAVLKTDNCNSELHIICKSRKHKNT